MKSTDDESDGNGSDDEPFAREAASLMAMLWFTSDRMRALGFEQCAAMIDDARVAFVEEISKAE